MNLKLKILFLLLFASQANATFVYDDIKLLTAGTKIEWNNNSQTFSIAASGSMSESVAYIWPPADAVSGGLALLSDGSGVLSFGVPTTSAAHNILSGTHDATTEAAVEGSIILGDATPEWSRLDIGGNQTVLVSNATTASWGTVDISGGTNLAVDTDHFLLNDDTLEFSVNQDTNLHTWQGSFLEQIDFTISGAVTGSLEKEGTGDLTMFFSDEYTVLDCTPALTVDLTPLVGTDTSPAAAFVYILQSDKLLTAAASWPAASIEHIRVASVVLQSAATTGTNNALMNRNWNDYAFGITDPRGGTIQTNERARHVHASWDSGVVLSITGDGTGTITLDTTAGAVFQLRLQTFPAIDMAGADDIHLVNLSGSEYSTSVNLVADITTLADSVTALANNKYFNIVIWGIQNRTGESSHLMCNLPTGQYNTSLGGTTDPTKFSVFTIPVGFRGTGFLIAELTFQLTGGGTTWTLIQNKDLLGQTPTLVPGGGTTAAVSIFSDSAFEVFDNGDDTKRMDFELSGITTGNTRTMTVPDASGNIAYTSQSDGTIDHGADVSGLTGDDHTQYVLHSLADAANDFLVASEADTFVKKTLAETGAILEADIDHGNIQGLSDGADHSFIDQDVTKSSDPCFAALEVNAGDIIVDRTGDAVDATINITAGEAKDAMIELWQDEGDDTVDKWAIEAQVAGARLAITNNSSTMFDISTGGDIFPTGDVSLGASGSRIVATSGITYLGPDNSFDLASAAVSIDQAYAAAWNISGPIDFQTRDTIQWMRDCPPQPKPEGAKHEFKGSLLHAGIQAKEIDSTTLPIELTAYYGMKRQHDRHPNDPNYPDPDTLPQESLPVSVGQMAAWNYATIYKLIQELDELKAWKTEHEKEIP